MWQITIAATGDPLNLGQIVDLLRETGREVTLGLGEFTNGLPSHYIVLGDMIGCADNCDCDPVE